MHPDRRSAFQAACATAVLVLATACGSAIPHDQVVAAARGVAGTGVAAGTTGAAGTGTTGSGATVGGAGAAGTGAVAGTSGAAGTAGGVAAAGGAAGGGAAKAGTAGGGGAAAAGGGDTSPIIIGTVGNFSGAPGVVNKPSATGVQVWAAAVNAKGGIAGHPVKVIVQDDQADPARYRQILQDMVENKHVIAFVGNGTSTTVQAGTSYLEKVRVPVVGSGDGSPAWHTSKMQFDVAGDADALVYGDFSIAKKQGKTKIALLACVEASSCTGWKATAEKYAPRLGVKLVYEANVSITQPNFTSECLNARNAGADVMAVIADQNTGYRAASDCAQQGFKPTYIAANPADADTQKPNLEGEIGASHTFPFVGVPGNPLADEFIADLKRYGAFDNKSQYLATGFASGKLFEAAFLKGVGKAKPTSKGVLEGLWSLPKGDTLGGWVLPINFKREGPATPPPCYYPLLLKGGKWTTPDAMKPTCYTK